MPQLADREVVDKVILQEILEYLEQQETLPQQLLLKVILVEMLLFQILLHVLKLAEVVVELVLLE
tara:strand:+ start:291 stop:485 length:195 start_codon:yes stop_codon:yes gene_type:complete